MDAATVSALFTRHYRDIYRYLARMAGRADVADDLAQEVFLRAVKAGGQDGQRVTHERGWIFSIARHLFVDYCRRERRRAESVTVTVEPARYGSQQLAAELTQALGRLSEADRECFLLKEIGGLSYQEIADACGCTTEAVRARLYRTRASLRAALSL